MRMWFGLEIDVVGLPPLVTQIGLCSIVMVFLKGKDFSVLILQMVKIVYLNNKKKTFSYMFPIAGQTAGPNGF